MKQNSGKGRRREVFKQVLRNKKGGKPHILIGFQHFAQ
jgi:hypothetical protein